MFWCAEEDSNLHVREDTATSRQPGYQLQHPRKIVIKTHQLYLKLALFSIAYVLENFPLHLNK